MDFLAIVLFFISGIISLVLKNKHYMVSSLLNLLRCVSSCRVQTLLVNILCELGNNVEYLHHWMVQFIDSGGILPSLNSVVYWSYSVWFTMKKIRPSGFNKSNIFHRVLETRKWKIKLSKGVFYSEASSIGSCQLTVYSVFCLVHTWEGMKSKLSGVVRSFSQERHSLLFHGVALLFCFGFSFLACFVRQSDM